MENTNNKFEKKTFIFDFDSTIFPGETLDEIIDFALQNDPQRAEKSREITRICNLGMAGEISMEESLRRRLQIASPTKEIIRKYVQENKNRIEPKFRGILHDLQAAGHQVLVVSGGFEEWIVPLLEGIVPAGNIHANRIKDPEKPMTIDNIIRRTKEEIIQTLKDTGKIKNPAKITMVGDGMTDFTVFENEIAQEFIGAFFYENRPKVREKAEKFKQKVFNSLDDFVKYIRKKSLMKLAA